MIGFAKYIWQLPQNLIGLLLTRFCTKTEMPGIYTWSYKSGVCLGEYIIVNVDCNMRTVQHECGHRLQSLYLGPLYLILIGLFSLLGNLVHRVIKFDYYKQPWERWADVLGGVKR